MTTPAHQAREGSPWATGFAAFACVMMLVLGSFHAIMGLVAVFNDEFFVNLPDYTFELDITVWGWIHLIGGAIVVWAGVSLLSGRLWARAVGIALAVLSAVVNFLWLPYYPVGSVALIGLAVVVIWALIRYQPAPLPPGPGPPLQPA
jgi:hypothetical protein